MEMAFELKKEILIFVVDNDSLISCLEYVLEMTINFVSVSSFNSAFFSANFNLSTK